MKRCRWSNMVIVGLVLSIGLGVGTLETRAADYPSREIEVMVPWGVGGSTDTVFRNIFDRASEISQSAGNYCEPSWRRGCSGLCRGHAKES